MKTKLSLCGVGLLCAVLLWSFASFSTEQMRAQASAASGLSGYAWSDNIGFINFNSTASPAYGVDINASTGDLSGQAWSDSLGWLSFDRTVTGNPPSDDAGSGAIAKRVGGTIVGWGRFTASCQWNLLSGQNCTGSTPGNANGIVQGSTAGQYWDGWVSFNRKTGDAYDYSTLIDGSNRVIGDVWGGNVVGWINFDQGTATTTPQCNPAVEVCVGGNPINLSCSVSPSTGALPGPVNATWTAVATGGTAQYAYTWNIESESVQGSPIAVEYNTSGLKSAFVSVSDSATPALTYGPISCSNSLNISGDTGTTTVPIGSCSIPSNARLCPGSNLNGTTGSLSSSCPAVVASCQFTCTDNINYVVRGNICVKKSVTIEK